MTKTKAASAIVYVLVTCGIAGCGAEMAREQAIRQEAEAEAEAALKQTKIAMEQAVQARLLAEKQLEAANTALESATAETSHPMPTDGDGKHAANPWSDALNRIEETKKQLDQVRKRKGQTSDALAKLSAFGHKLVPVDDETQDAKLEKLMKTVELLQAENERLKREVARLTSVKNLDTKTATAETVAEPNGDQ